jgi:tetratricopeptide (TPR) repeat protein
MKNYFNKMKSTLLFFGLLLSFLTGMGQSATDYYERGLEKYSSADYGGAKRDFNKAIRLNPNFAAAYAARGNAKQRAYNQDLRGALYDYSKAIQFDPNHVKAHVNRGLLKSRSEDYHGANEDFTRAIELKPDYARAYRFRGDSKKMMGDESGALADYEAATEIELKPKTPVAKIDSSEDTEGVKTREESVIVNKNPKSIVVDMSAFVSVEKDINFAGVQLQNARKTFGVGFFLNLLGGALATGGYFAKNPKVQTGLVVAGGVTSLVGSVVMITAVIPIGGAGKILQRVRFPKTLPVKVE